MTSETTPTFRGRPLRPDFGDGQTFKVVGLGGVGSIVARFATVFIVSLADSLGRAARIVLIDGDSFEPSNASRMLFPRMGNKAAVLRDELLARFPRSNASVEAIEEYVTASNAGRLLREGDVVLLALDNHAGRKLVSDQVGRLDHACLISGGNDGVGADSTGRMRRGTYGNCQIYIRRGGKDYSPSLVRYHEEIAQPADRSPDEASCVEALEKVPQNLFANLAAASSLLNALWLYLCGDGVLHYSEIAFDIAEGLMRPLPRPAPGEPS